MLGQESRSTWDSVVSSTFGSKISISRSKPLYLETRDCVSDIGASREKRWHESRYKANIVSQASAPLYRAESRGHLGN